MITAPVMKELSKDCVRNLYFSLFKFSFRDKVTFQLPEAWHVWQSHVSFSLSKVCRKESCLICFKRDMCAIYVRYVCDMYMVCARYVRDMCAAKSYVSVNQKWFLGKMFFFFWVFWVQFVRQIFLCRLALS